MTAAEAFADRIRTQTVAYAPWLDRAQSRRVLEDQGLPEPRSEAWRYSNPNRWYDGQTTVSAPPEDGPRSVRAHVVDFETAIGPDRERIEQSMNAAVDPTKHPLAAVNDIAMRLGLLVHVPAADEAAVVELGELGGGFERILVLVEPNASLTLVERAATPKQRVVECILGEGARLDHVRLQPSATSVEYHLVAARLGPACRYHLAQYSQGTALRRNDLHVRIAGRGAEVEVRCGYRLAERSHLDTQVGIEHEAPDAASRQVARGVVGDHAKAVLNGRIHVAPDAQRTDAALTTKSLLLAPTAELNAKPELTIYADDVRCAHGATVGELDADALFYLRSRGVTAAAARELLIGGFLAEAVGDLAVDAARDLLGIAP